MYLIKSDKIIPIVLNALHECNEGMASHGMRMSYMLYSLLSKDGKYNDDYIHNLCLISAWHDVGVYMMDKKTIASADKQAYYTFYGYAFAKKLYPSPEYAKIILYHHFDSSLHFSDMEFRDISRYIHLLNRVDYLYSKGAPISEIIRYLSKNSDRNITAIIREMYCSNDLSRQAIQSDPGYSRILLDWPYSVDEINALLMMLVLMIDFKSPYTMDHTFSTCAISQVLSELLGLSLHDRMRIRTGAILHDLGKIAIPVSILDKPGKLNSRERGIIRSHVDIGKRIISGNVDEDTADIAIRHHERLDGSGYSSGLQERDLTLNGQLVAVSDIFSALISNRSYKKPYVRNQVLRILRGMAKAGYINKHIAGLCETNYDYIMSQVRNQAVITRGLYKQIHMEHQALLKNARAG